MSISEIEKQFFECFGIGEPVIRKWQYEGFYEDYYWNDYLENCEEILKSNNLTVEEFNKRIQNSKTKAWKLEEDVYDRFTDSIRTQFGQISEAFMSYPKISDRELLELLCVYNEFQNSYELLFIPSSITELKNSLLRIMVDSVKNEQANKYFCNDVEKLKGKVKELFEGIKE